MSSLSIHFFRASQLGVAVDAPPALPLPGGQPHHRHHERLLRRARAARGARHLTDQSGRILGENILEAYITLDYDYNINSARLHAVYKICCWG